MAVAITCGFWWSYFTRAKPELDHALESRRGAEQSTLARDVFSLAHFPMLCGVVAYALAIEEAIAHPSEPLALEVRAALAGGVALFVDGMAVAMWRATGRLLLARVFVTVGVAIAVLVVTRVAPSVTLGIVLVGTTTIATLEQRVSSPTVSPQM